MLIGFSRGAFTVRAVAALIEDVGLLTKSGLGSLAELYKEWKYQTRDEAKDAPAEPVKKMCKRLIKANELRPAIRVKVCAVWDTVGSLGVPVPDPFPQKISKRLAHVNSRLCKNIDVAIQALALNERRKHFQTTVWRADQALEHQILKQCWFLGAHSDVGGGNKDTGLANLTLVWMIAQLDDYIHFNHAALLDFTSGYLKETNSSTREFNLTAVSIGVGIAGFDLSKTVEFSSRTDKLLGRNAGNHAQSLGFYSTH
jgi:uncharacterized protein (DUF2235 family)